MAKVGRTPISIDWKQFEGLCAMQCTLREIANHFLCSEDTIERRVKEHYSCGFSDIFKRKRVAGLISLRRNLFEMSKKQPQVAIFLAKNWLGMADKQEIEVGNKDTISELTDAELEELISRRRGGGATKEAAG